MDALPTSRFPIPIPGRQAGQEETVTCGPERPVWTVGSRFGGDVASHPAALEMLTEVRKAAEKPPRGPSARLQAELNF